MIFHNSASVRLNGPWKHCMHGWRQLFLQGIPVIAWLAGFTAYAEEQAFERIEVFPSQIQLDFMRDQQSIVVIAHRPDGRTLDVTETSTMSLTNPAIATFHNGMFTPIADGSCMLTITYAGHCADIPVTISGATLEPPISFRTDVMPVFARGGCNTGSCHGAARGKDGFRLSLFGFDPAGDYQRITREFPGRRIDLGDPIGGLLVQKAVGGVPHTGGKRFALESALAATLVRWISEGAPDDSAVVPQLVGLDLYPPEAILDDSGTRQRLVAVARFADGTDRDVTDLCWYGSNNDSSAKVSPNGIVTTNNRGEAFIMARYQTITVGMPLVIIPKDLSFSFSEAIGNTWIDDLVDTKLKKLRIHPSSVCDDETFLRRATIDLVGMVPTLEQRDRFLADASENKRSVLIDELMTSKEFVEIWVMKWAEILQIRSSNNQVSPKGAILYHQWLDRRIAANEPLDTMVRELLVASGGTFENPPTNYFQLERNTLKLSENVAQAFLGMRIQCAQCHNHPFDRWTMDDYYGFAAFFPQIGRKRAADPRESIVFDSGSGEVKHPIGNANVAPKFLGAETPKVSDRDRRESLAKWITSPDNPFFSKHIANLTWTHFLGRGIVHEPDDARVSNPPSNDLLLEGLGKRLSDSGWDFRTLVRDICNSKTYQRSSVSNESNHLDTTHFSHALIRRVRAEVLLDVVSSVTQTKNKFPGLPLGAHAVQVADGKTTNYFLTTFGRATRDDVCSCAVSMEPSLSQALHLLNGDAVHDRITQGKLIEQRMQEEQNNPDIIKELFIRCFCRSPDENELTDTLAIVESAPDRRQALEDVFWALINSPEFIFNH
ncbi:MAG: DUF1549 and DUF1553 domain-containing protein [Planctomycetota bacterium]